MKTVAIIFSPTGGNEKAAHIISGCWGGEVEQIDLSDAKADFSKCSIDSADMVLIAMPSFGAVSYTHLDVYKRQRYAYSYREHWMPKDISVVYRMYQINLDGQEMCIRDRP